jgi:hypothetical protein
MNEISNILFNILNKKCYICDKKIKIYKIYNKCEKISCYQCISDSNTCICIDCIV